MSTEKKASEAKIERIGTPSNVDHDVIRELAQLLEETDLTEIEIERAGFRVRVSRQQAGAISAQIPIAAPAAPQPIAGDKAGTGDASLAAHPGVVPSPMVGTAYVAPKPGDDPFVTQGDMVAEGQTVMIIEAMKTMNTITAPKAGRVTQILVTDAQPVEFGEPLLIIE